MPAKARTSKETEPSQPKPDTEVVGVSVAVTTVEAPAPAVIFFDKRSGRDRREENGPTFDSRRVSGERRRSHVTPSFWWLEKNYVDSHQFSMVTPEDTNPAQRGGTRYT